MGRLRPRAGVLALPAAPRSCLFQPVRRRVQATIDRRFNRARSDAERVVTAFSARTRDQVDLGGLRRSVRSAATEAVHPAGSALWLRPGAAGSTGATSGRARAPAL